MGSSSIFTRKIMGLDINVWLIMLLCIVISSGLLGYNLIKKEDSVPCKSINIFVNGRLDIENNDLNVGESVTFRSPVSPGDEVVWDFGDDTKNVEGFSALHVFNRESIFTVRAIVNGKCEYVKKLRVKKAIPPVRDSITGEEIVPIIGADEGLVKENITFSTPLEAQNYTWYIENNQNYGIHAGKAVTFSFKTQAEFIVVLMLDNDSQKKYRKSITISKPAGTNPEIPKKLIPTDIVIIKADTQPAKETAKVAPPPVAAPKFKYVSDEIFRNYLQALVCGEINVNFFDAYLCQGGVTPVIINNKERKTFAGFCGEIKGKKIKIESVVVGRDNDKCVINLTINFDRKGFLGKNPCKN